MGVKPLFSTAQQSASISYITPKKKKKKKKHLQLDFERQWTRQVLDPRIAPKYKCLSVYSRGHVTCLLR